MALRVRCKTVRRAARSSPQGWVTLTRQAEARLMHATNDPAILASARRRPIPSPEQSPLEFGNAVGTLDGFSLIPLDRQRHNVAEPCTVGKKPDGKND